MFIRRLNEKSYFKMILISLLFSLNYIVICFLIAWLGVSSWPDDRFGIVISWAILFIIFGTSIYWRKSLREHKEKHKSLGDADKKHLSTMAFLSGLIFAPAGFTGFKAIEACYKSEMKLMKCCIILALSLVILNVWVCYINKHAKVVLDCQKNTVSGRNLSKIIGGIALVVSWGMFLLLI